MGPAMVIELTLQPKQSDTVDAGGHIIRRDMTLHRLAWPPQRMFQYVEEGDGARADQTLDVAALGRHAPANLQGKARNDAFATDFRSRVGGLRPQIESIVRRVLDGRVLRPAEVDARGNALSYREAREGDARGDAGDTSSSDDTATQLSLAALEAEELALLGLTPVRGLLLYGPPGCGKTALAREISRALRARAPKIVAAPELLDRWVGGSERLVRELFQDAEAELASANGDAARSALHVIVIDEIDAVFRRRSGGEDSGEATRSSTVNQILAKLDGVNAISNVLLIGMTNRRELLDEALLRPGRLEVQIMVPLPNRDGRREILNIHFDALRKRGRLSRPLCAAIDGVAMTSGLRAWENASIAKDSSMVDVGASVDDTPNRGTKRRALKRAISYISPVKRGVYDLADDAVTGGFSGADLEGLVRCAGSIALSRVRKDGVGVEALLITLDDVKRALAEIQL